MTQNGKRMCIFNERARRPPVSPAAGHAPRGLVLIRP